MLPTRKLITLAENNRSLLLPNRTTKLIQNYIRAIIEMQRKARSRHLSTTEISPARDKCTCEAADVMDPTRHKPLGTHRLSGAIRERPETKRFFPLRAIMVVIPFLFFGGMMSKRGAKLLQDYEIFVPEEDEF